MCMCVKHRRTTSQLHVHVHYGVSRLITSFSCVRVKANDTHIIARRTTEKSNRIYASLPSLPTSVVALSASSAIGILAAFISRRIGFETLCM